MSDRRDARAARRALAEARDRLTRAIEAVSGPRPDWERFARHVEAAAGLMSPAARGGRTGAERAKHAQRMRTRCGCTYGEIGRALGCTPDDARRLVREAGGASGKEGLRA